MHIKEITISNYRGLEINSMQLDKSIIIFGKNDSRKTSFFSAIKKVLIFQERKKELSETDSTNMNKKDIKIEILLDVTDIDYEKENIILKYIYSDQTDDKKYLKILFSAQFNEKSNSYEETLTVDADGDLFHFSSNKWIPLIDEIISVIYIPSSYNINDDKKNFFNYRKKIIDNEKKENIFVNIKNSIDEFNNKISLEPFVNDIANSINDNKKFELMNNVVLNISSNVKNNDIFKSLDVLSFYESKNIPELGDGRNRILSLILRIKSMDMNNIIILLEEPENHLYIHYQKNIINELKSYFDKNIQIICSTHSPYVVDYKKVDQLIKFEYKDDKFNFYNCSLSTEFKDDDKYFFNIEFSEMLFYDKVILVEGYTEKFFYNYLTIFDDNFHCKIVKNNIGFLFSFGIAFDKPKKILDSLNIKTYILTDNDYKEDKDKHDYFGIKRCYNYLDENTQNIFKSHFSFINCEDFKSSCLIEEKELAKITNFFEANNIFIPPHHEGFEKDFIDFLGIDEKLKEEEIAHLKKQKLKNLVECIFKNKALMVVNGNNQKNRLIKVIYNGIN